MAPEILRYEFYDAKVDLWSVGAVTYEMLTGRPPYRADNHVQLLQKIERSMDVIRFPDENGGRNDSASTSSQLSLSDLVPGIEPTSQETENTSETAAVITLATNRLRADLDPEIKDLIRQLLKRNPKERMEFPDFFVHPALKPKPKSPIVTTFVPSGVDTEFANLSIANSIREATSESIIGGQMVPEGSLFNRDRHMPVAQVSGSSLGGSTPPSQPTSLAHAAAITGGLAATNSNASSSIVSRTSDTTTTPFVPAELPRYEYDIPADRNYSPSSTNASTGTSTTKRKRDSNTSKQRYCRYWLWCRYFSLVL